MLSKAQAGRKTGEGSVRGKFLTEIETISKTLYLARSTSCDSITTASSGSNSTRKAKLSDRKSKPKASNEDTSRKDKKSIWNWRPLKAFSNSRNQRFNCCFSLVVLSIEELPSTFDDATLCVYWKRKDGVLITHPAKVVHGMAEFGEKLTYTCSVYGNKNGPHKSAKYEAKHFLLYASILDAPEVDLGKHRVDLTKLLPLKLEELKEEKSSGKWTTSYILSGMARGAVMNVSFEYSTRATQDSQNNAMKLDMKPSLGEKKFRMKRVESLPSISNNFFSQPVDEVKDLHEVLPTSSSEPASSIDALFQNFDEEKKCSPLHDKPELDGIAKNLEPIKPDTSPISDCGKESECENNEENMFSAVHDKPDIPNIFFPQAVDEVKDLHEVLPTSSSEPASSIDALFQNFDEEKKCSPLHDKPELDDIAKNLEPIKPDTFPISDCGKENECENSEENMFGAVHDEPDIPNIFFPQAVDEAKDLHEVLPTLSSELASPIDAVFLNFAEEKTCSPLHDKPELDDIAKNLEPIKPDTFPISDCGKENECENSEENMFGAVHDKPDIPNIFPQAVDEEKDLHEVLPTSSSELASPIDAVFLNFDEEKTCSPLHDKPELDDLAKILEPIKPDSCPISHCGKENEHENSEETMLSLVHDQPDIDASTENVESIKPDAYSLSDSGKEHTEECAANKFCVTDQGMESLSDKAVRVEEYITKDPDDSAVDCTGSLDTDGIQIFFDDHVKHDSLDEGSDSSEEKAVVHECAYEEDDLCTEELLMKELELTLNKVSDLETVAPESPQEENYREAKSEYKIRKSHSLNDVTESVATEFLSMLGIDQSSVSSSSGSGPESPRERLLRQFEEEFLAEGFSIFNFDMDEEDEAEGGHNAYVGSELLDLSEGLKSSSQLQDVQEGHPVEVQEVMSKQRAMNLEDLETETLMCEWSLNEKAFERSPPKNSSGFGSPIDLPPEKPLGLPSLAEGLGPFVQTKNKGFLRSMNPSLFRNAKSDGSLIMLVSRPVVVSEEMGSGIMEILQHLASVGIEKLSMQANKLMPLEDVTGKNMHQLGWEALPVLEVAERQCLLQNDLVLEQDGTYLQRGLKGTLSGRNSSKFSSRTVGDHTGSEFVSVEDLASLPIDKIEALSIEGLRIQSGMSGENAPSNIIARSIDDISDLQGKGINNSRSLVLKRAAGLQLLDLKDSSKDVDGIMGLSVTLDEWMRMDSGEIDDMDNISEHTSKILAAHQANSFDLIHGSSKGQRKRGKSPGRNCGLLGNNSTVALMVSLCDPLRNYEPVGMPMLTLVQVERVLTPPKPKIYGSVFEVRDNSYGDDTSEHNYQKFSIDQCTIFRYLHFSYPCYHLKYLFLKKLCKKVAYSIPLPMPRSYTFAFKTIAKVSKKEERSSEEEGVPQFRISEVHFAGLKIETPKNKLGGTSSQQQSGSRWLLANGMGKSNKHPLLRSKAASKFGAPGDTLWSVSSCVHGGTRNSNVIISNVIKRFFGWRAE